MRSSPPSLWVARGAREGSALPLQLAQSTRRSYLTVGLLCWQVGGEVARRAKGLGMTVIAYDPYASEERAAAVGVQLVTFDEALAAGDFFSLHMPLTPSTKELFNDEAFAKMKKGGRIINVARGGVIDDAALARALDSGKVAGAALDVYAVEPPPAGEGLRFRGKGCMV